MKKKNDNGNRILIDAYFPSETRVVLTDNEGKIDHIEYELTHKKPTQGNIYLAKVTRVEPGLQAAFVDYGAEKSGFLSFNEIHSDYYHVFASDRPDEEINLNELEETQHDHVNTENDQKLPKLEDGELSTQEITNLVDNNISSDFNIEENEIEEAHIIRQEKNEEKKHYKIQEVIKKGQILLVQVIKEERGNKGAFVTTYISLAGKYCVMMPNNGFHNGVSKKISNANERKRIKDILDKLNIEKEENTASFIARTAAVGRDIEEIGRDYNYLVLLWNKIREITLKSSAPSFIHEEDNVILRALRNLANKNLKEIVIQGNKAYEQCMKYMQKMLPNDLTIVKEYKKNTPIFTYYNVEDQITQLYHTNVTLPSGGYIVIHPTEALISIDINSGKATAEHDVEHTALSTNLEAAKEIAKQIRLRDLAGLIVVDFIDMYKLRHKKILERSLREFLKYDKARIHTGYISNFGLLEMSRQRLRPSFLELNAVACEHCSGKGIIRMPEANSRLILRILENELNDKIQILNIFTNQQTALLLLNERREEIAMIEQKYSVKINVNIDPEMVQDAFSIEKIKHLPNKKDKKLLPSPAFDISELKINSDKDNETAKDQKNKDSDNQNNDTKNVSTTRKRTRVNKKRTNATKENSDNKENKPKNKIEKKEDKKQEKESTDQSQENIDK